MKFRDIYSNDFIDLINSINTNSKSCVIDPNAEVGNFIDVKEMLQRCGYTVEEINLKGLSGHLVNKTIKIDKYEVNTRKRFTMGHELGHILQGQVDEQRRDDSSDYNREKRKSEALANNVAAQLLMPLKLVKKTIDEVINENGFNEKSISENELDTIIEKTAKKLVVSKQALTIRVDSLNIFDTVGD